MTIRLLPDIEAYDQQNNQVTYKNLNGKVLFLNENYSMSL